MFSRRASKTGKREGMLTERQREREREREREKGYYGKIRFFCTEK
jgi:hypothetical protein